MYIKKLFRRIYPADGVTFHTNNEFETAKLYGSDVRSSSNEGRAYTSHPLTLLFSFLGLPHRLVKLRGQQSVMNMLKNFIGWRDNVNTRLNYPLIPLFILLHLVTVPVKFAINILKLFTEYLPQILTNYTYLAALKFFWMSEDEDLISRLYIVPAVLVSLLFSAFAITAAVGSAITSPIDSVKYAARLGCMVKSNFLQVLLPILTLAFETFAFTIGIPLAIAATVPALSAITAVILSPLVVIGIGGFLIALPGIFGADFFKNHIFEELLSWFWYQYNTPQLPVQQNALLIPQVNDEEDELTNTAGIIRQLGGTIVITPTPATPFINTANSTYYEDEAKLEEDLDYTPTSTLSFASQK